ncbi:SPFH domain-containing protein [Nonomuraea sp. NPDC049725]|uniref:SPFH domain-containing protein n=1 Tax=Nonomuraea sp. NPDC049725 TaxID=3154508 RepID=UPI00344402AF
MDALDIAEPGLWILLGLSLLVIAGRCFRVVGEDERLVVRRFGRTKGVRGPGPVVMWPALDREVRVPLRLEPLELFCAGAVTRDGVTVQVTAAALTAVTDPVRFATAVESPAAATAMAVEGELRRHIAQRDLAELPALAAYDHAALADRVSETSGRWGVEVVLLDVTDVQIPLSGGLVHWLESRAGAR